VEPPNSAFGCRLPTHAIAASGPGRAFGFQNLPPAPPHRDQRMKKKKKKVANHKWDRDERGECAAKVGADNMLNRRRW